LVIALFIAIIAAYLLAWNGYGQRVDFTEYKPTALPVDLRTTTGTFFVLHDKNFAPSFAKHIIINFNVPNSWIGEWKSNGHLTNPCSEFPQETDCQTHKTLHGQQYQVTSSPDKAGTYTYDVRFIKGDTEIWMTIREIKQDVSVKEWGSIVDSFQTGHYAGLKTFHGSSSGP
jgi:hypothetical protein